ncbi:MAG: 16S rRNA (uracil(1498)-N(3))-methyltransferase [Alphaproteobacteria bacterium RBG_16_64_48]|nr:MAG: 16S rRNA (uracil(1498)-N(3))-methyltransferase [Alphaproteobacteria bacterium RBG_16_64_48]
MSSKLQRLFIKSPLVAGGAVALDKDQAHYLGNVLRLKPGERLLLFNGKDGEWCAELSAIGRKEAQVRIEHQTRPQEQGPDLHYLFAPLKRARLDYMAQKATEMGVSALRPVITRHTVAERVKTGRLLANAIEAAEQCGILRVPEVMEPENLSKLIGAWDEERLLIFADEAAPHASPIEALKARGPSPVAVLIGPEGGFEREERAALLAKSFVLPISLGPRVMRADTAAVAALALVNAVLGDWQ